MESRLTCQTMFSSWQATKSRYRRPPLHGRCECCDVKYTEGVEKHRASWVHRNFARDASNYANIDKHIIGGLTLYHAVTMALDAVSSGCEEPDDEQRTTRSESNENATSSARTETGTVH